VTSSGYCVFFFGVAIVGSILLSEIDNGARFSRSVVVRALLCSQKKKKEKDRALWENGK
jgi:hypothetical protein